MDPIDPLVLTIRLKDYKLSIPQITWQAEEHLGRPMTNSDDSETVTFGFEQPGLKEGLLRALEAFRR
jgi:hypothetical protein